MAASIRRDSPTISISYISTEDIDDLWNFIQEKMPKQPGFYVTYDHLAQPSEMVVWWDGESWVLPNDVLDFRITAWREIEESSEMDNSLTSQWRA